MVARRYAIFLLALLGVPTMAAQAGWFDGPGSIVQDVKRRQCWPKPFVYPDRESVDVPFALMISNGWRRQNTLGDYHFGNDNQLTEAGRLKVQWIVTQAPEQHRTIFVQRGPSPQDTAARVNAVQQVAAASVVQGAGPLVLETDLPAPSWPAERVDVIGRQFQKSAPLPRLPAAQGGAEGSGGGGGGGNGGQGQ